MKKKLLIIVIILFYVNIEAQVSVLVQADSILQTGNYRLALQQLKKSNDESYAISKKIASIYQTVGNSAKAIKYYQKAFQLQPSDEIKEQLAKSYQFSGNTAKAIRLFNEVLQGNPNNYLLKYTLAKLYLAERNAQQSITLLNELIENDPSNPNYYYQLGKAYEKTGKDPSKGYLKAYLLDSLHIKSIYQLAKFFKAIKVRDSSELFIDIGLKLNPKSLNFLQLKAQNEFLNKAYDSTITYLKKLEAQNFKTLFVYKLFGLSYYKLKDYENALAYFNKAKQLDFRDASILYNKGLVLKAMGKYKMAEITFFMSILSQKPDVDKNYYQMGLVQLEQKRIKNAISSFEKGYKNNSRNHILLFQLALTADDYYDDKKIALQYFEKYINTFPEKDKKSTAYAKQRSKEIRKALFMK
jgi:tetratricopeptide (TPR) repeat protein